MHKSLSENGMKQEIRKAKIVNYTVFLIFFCLLLAIVAGYFVYHHRHTFNSDRWLNEPSERTDMIDDLLRNYELVGSTEAEVLALLGPCDNAHGAFGADNRYVYYLGPERALFSIDSEWLLIDFTNDIVSDYSLTTD